MLLELAQRAPVQCVDWPEWAARGVEVSIWRLDMLDAAAPGNKLFKLAENLQAARRAGHSRILSFGGAFSNHIHALALSGHAAGLETVGIIRGEPAARTNPTLSDAAAAGMQLHFIDRASYRALTQEARASTQKNRVDDGVLPELQRRYGPCYVIPEGGSNRLGVLGCRALGVAIGAMAPPPDCVVLPVATGSTLAGIVAGLSSSSPLLADIPGAGDTSVVGAPQVLGTTQVLGIAVLKGGSFIAEQVQAHLCEDGAEHGATWRVELDHHGGGYARTPEPLRRFVARFGERTGVRVEPVYSGKMLYAIHQLIERGEFASGTRILAVHTGGMQGARGAKTAEQGP